MHACAGIDEAAILVAKRKVKCARQVMNNEKLIDIVTTTDIVTEALGLAVMQ